MTELSPREEEILRDAFGFITSRERRLWKLTASEGTVAVEEVLGRLIEAVRTGEEPDWDKPVRFLSDTALEIWASSKSLEPIFYLYQKYYFTRSSSPGDPEGPNVGIGFPNVMGKITSELEGRDRDVAISSTVSFIISHEEDLENRVIDLLRFSEVLFENGAEKEAKEITQTLYGKFKDMIEKIDFAKEIIKEIGVTS